jgi:hypothetical protein
METPAAVAPRARRRRVERSSSCPHRRLRGPRPGHDNDYCWIIRVVDGRIVEVTAFFDGSLVEELFRTTERNDLNARGG